MDKDNKDDFTFAKLSDLTLPFTFRMYAMRDNIFFAFSDITDYRRSQLEGTRHPRSVTELLDKPELRFHGVQSL
jgi:phosphatidylinositol 3-kinase